MPVLPFRTQNRQGDTATGIGHLLDGVSLEVMPRTAAKIPDFRPLLPQDTRIYIAHVEGTPIDDMIATAHRLRGEGFTVMPHVPARLIRDRNELRTWLHRYRAEAGVTEALVLAGGPKTPAGAFDSSIRLLETGEFEAAGFTRLHVAGHPEGNRDIDPEGGTRLVDEALFWKQDYARSTSAEMAIVTQFAFDAGSILAWDERLRANGVSLPVHLGIAGPAKLQTLLKFAIACGVGPSLSVLKKRAADVTRLLRPFEPDALLSDLVTGLAQRSDSLIQRIHVFPLGGIGAACDYVARHTARTTDKADAERGSAR
ncbi:methylenetetrahydrofolate reductase [Ovoidimarina sediminis]|uniref:methylenetetrahydrofolate reductase n=1 Tax=Ovoidimarina sediminis TaxID=3079856 RepID=UPI00290F0240|nr:methylenetetrahydrofolate reductase [Rhodophyticola sp. MJ-SS7]MDU8944677.1 methylenetetrahydrofolate reductase [Rhodophyticola sp. MJ-SS7]